jgi:hypothetical protein
MSDVRPPAEAPEDLPEDLLDEILSWVDGTVDTGGVPVSSVVIDAGVSDATTGLAVALRRPSLPLQAGDPLGLGLAYRPPPPDPETYNRAREDTEYARSLLSEIERAEVDAAIAAHGFLTVAEVRAIVAENTAKGSVETGGLDPEVLALLDARINYKVFIAGDNLYTREELCAHYPFHEFGVPPEAVFAQQELGVFPPRAGREEVPEYAARDAGDESLDFLLVEDLIGQATRPGYAPQRRPSRVVKTKIYVGKERWDDFLHMQRFCRGAVRLASVAPESAPARALVGVLAAARPALTSGPESPSGACPR